MTEAAHFVVGAAICRYVRSKPLALALAFASHFALDAIPHFEHPRLIGMKSWIPVAAVGWLLALSAGLAIWLRFRPSQGSAGGYHLYLIAGGFLGGLVDQLMFWSGRGGPLGVIWEANRQAHWWEARYRSLTQDPQIGPPAAVAACVVEIGLAALATWLLFRARAGGVSGARDEE
ncbi:MAG: hypothetical protein FJX74_14955 [Armatimonadetes bacterium]|nr:hypothetical protein [Armatimonadota bacterium]